MTRRGFLLFASLSILWGIPYLLIRVAVRQVDPSVLVLARTLPASMLLLPLVIYRHEFTSMIKNLKWIFLFGAIEFGIPWYFMGTVEKHVTSSFTSLMIATVPLFSLGISKIRGVREHMTPERWFGLAIGGIGVLSLVGFDLRGGALKWAGLMLLVCIGYAAGPVILATKVRDVAGIAMVTGATGVIGLLWIPYSVSHWPHAIALKTVLALATLSVACTVGAFLVFFELIKEVGAARATVVTYMNTAIAVVLGIIFLNEPLTTGIAIGFPLVLIGSYYATGSNRLARSESKGSR
jgi:drug/metabolite transporter (DMT)-like permease